MAEGSREARAEILTVDDNTANLAVLTELLMSAGYESAVATSGERAIQQLVYERPDLILLDIQMPGLDGFETCRRIKANAETANIPIILITANSDIDSIKMGFSAGAVDYISKPFQEDELLARVETHLQLRHVNQLYDLEQEKNEQLDNLNQRLLAIQQKLKVSNLALEKQLKREQLLISISNDIRQNLTPSRIVQTAVDAVGRVFQVDRCLIYLYESSFRTDLPCVAEYLQGELPSLKGQEFFVADNPHTQIILSQDRALSIPNLNQDDLFRPTSLPAELPTEQRENHSDICSILATRTSYQGHANGILSLHQTTYFRQWEPDEISFIEAISTQVGIALAQAQLLEREHQQRKAIEEAKQAADAANAAKSKFLANISHEFRTPLNAILGFSQLLQRQGLEQENQRDKLDIIHRSGTHLLNLINDVLEMSRIETGRVTLETNPINLHRFLDELQQMLQLKAAAKQLHLSLTYQPDVPQYVQGDERKLRQILLNLLENAIKFTSAGKVSLVVALGDPVASLPSPSWIQLRFSVSDTGPGIKREDMETIFQLFFQARTSKTLEQGAGLGLAISRQFSRLMGGDITLETTLGEGSTFHCQILMQQQPTLTLPESKTKKMSYKSSGITGIVDKRRSYRLLLVDDHEDNLLFLLQLLTIPGFELQTACDGEQAIQISRDWHPHLIWLDIQLPGMDGLETTRRIRQSVPYTTHLYPRIIALTANAFIEDRDAALMAGCDDFVAKPCSADTILDRTAQWLQVEFTNEAEPSPQRTVSTEDGSNLIASVRQGFQAMSRPWQDRFMVALQSLRSHELKALLSEIAPEEKEMRDAIATLLDDFRYDTILAILEDRQGLEDRKDLENGTEA